MKKIIIFRTDRLGDFIITTSLLKGIKKKFPKSFITVVTSKLNYDFVKKYKIINKVILYDKNFNLFYKFQLFRFIISKEYFASFSIDGKTFSNFCSFFLRSKYKFILFYKFKFLNLSIHKPNIIFKYLFSKYEIFTSKKFLQKVEHLPTKIISLGNHLNLNIKNTDKYYFKSHLSLYKFKAKFKNIIKKKYLLIHLDDKWCDIIDINKNFFKALVDLQKNTKKNIVLTSYKNNFEYYLRIKKKLTKLNSNKIMLVENSNLYEMEKLIKYSLFSISCHSGFLIQISGANSTKVVDIINQKDLLWYSCWKPLNTFHKFIYKSNYNIQISILDIFQDLNRVVSKY